MCQRPFTFAEEDTLTPGPSPACGRGEIDRGLSLAQRVHQKYRSAFDKLSERDRAAVALYFLPHASAKDVLEVTRPRVIKWYCPFADQREFPSGHRYCVNVYTGCEHRCQYCYARGYIAAEPNCKNRFRHDLCKDLEALEAYDVPPAPVHLSNSTDPLQPLEEQHRHTLFVLERLAEYRNRFTTVTLLTKNPAVLMDNRYVQVLHRLGELPPDHPRRRWFDAKGCSPLRVECSLAFLGDEHRRLLDPAARSVESRMGALRLLRKEGLPVFLRIDPLFPRDPHGALRRYLTEKDDLEAGRKPQREKPCITDALTVEQMVFLCLDAKRVKVESGEMEERTWKEYETYGDRMIRVFAAPATFVEQASLLVRRFLPRLPLFSDTFFDGHGEDGIVLKHAARAPRHTIGAKPQAEVLGHVKMGT